ncbi:hypothetical protein WH357_16415 [Enterobacter ludwigii]|jgi:hypothetical protein
MKKLLVLLLPLLLAGCATIVGDNEEQVRINSVPDHVRFAISDSDGQIVASGITPQTVTLKKADGSYFGKINYTLTLAEDGYNTSITPLSTNLTPWYLFGNLIFFGVPGWLIVDPFSGAMYSFKNNYVQTYLRRCPPGPYRYMCS